MEQVVLSIPEAVAANLRGHSSDSLSQRVLELAAIRAYESELITGCEVMELLGFDSREELFDLFKQYNLESHYTVEELERDIQSLEELLSKQ